MKPAISTIALGRWETASLLGLAVVYVAWNLWRGHRRGRINLGFATIERSWAARGDMRGALLVNWLFLVGLVAALVFVIFREH